MLTGKELGDAIAEAIRLKGVSKASVARHFGVKPPSISDWIKRGTIDKARLDELFIYFSSVVGPEHWGIARKAKQHWPTSLSVNEPKPRYGRALVQQVCDLAEQISDDGLRELAGFARCLTGTHPLTKAKRA